MELKGGGWVAEISNFDKMGGQYKMRGWYFDRIPIKWGGGGTVKKMIPLNEVLLTFLVNILLDCVNLYFHVAFNHKNLSGYNFYGFRLKV